MSKELEALRRIDGKNYLTEREHREFYSIIENALQRLESIDNANPSEALKETLKDIAIDLEYDDNPSLRDRYYGLLNVKQALIKAQKQEEDGEING